MPRSAPTRRTAARAAWSKAARRPRRRGAMRGGHALGGARSRQSPDQIYLCTLRPAGNWLGRWRYSLSGRWPLAHEIARVIPDAAAGRAGDPTGIALRVWAPAN